MRGRVRHRSEAVNIDRGQFVGRGLKDVAIIMALNELAPRPAAQILHPEPDKLRFEDLRLGVNNLRDHFGLEQQYEFYHGLENGLAGVVEAGRFPNRERVWLIKTGHGGSRIAQWAPDNPSRYWEKFVKRTEAARRQLPPTPNG